MMSKEDRARGVCAASAGNHALALAWHGKQLGIPVTVAMPTVAPLTKVQRCRSFGANVISIGQHIGEAKAYLQQEHPELRYVNGYDDPEIVAGAGTLAIEMLDTVPNADIIVVPVGGAGLIAGVSLAAKALNPRVRVIGVEPALCASFTAALAAGKPVTPTGMGPTLADGLAVPMVGPRAFEIARRFVDEVVTVSELLIAQAVLRLVESEKLICEGGGAAGLAGLLPGGPLDRPDIKGKTVVVPLCGGNIDSTLLGRVIDRGLAADGRLVRFVCTVSDRPGGIANLTRRLSEIGASIKDIYHERAWLASSVEHVQVKCVIETRGHEHNAEIRAMLEANYPTAFGSAAEPAF
jgi:threonine dehydratase